MAIAQRDPLPARRRAGAAARLAAAIATVVLLLVGIWVTGGLITNDFSLSMILTAVWVGLVGLACLALLLRRRDLGVPALVAYLIAAAVVGVYLGRSIFLDDEVDEQVATASGTAPAGAAADRPDGPSPEPENVLAAEGAFEPLEHQASGTASVIELAEGGRVLTLTDFEVDNGPDLRVYLVAGEPRDEADVQDFVDLGALKGNQGDQQYEIPSSVDIREHSTVVIWCRAFSVAFARAQLER